MTKQKRQRDLLFISKATPEDNSFVEWLAPRLESAGYPVFADILNLEPGERWRKTLTDTLQKRAMKMLLICSEVGLQKDGVQEELGIATDVSREIQDSKFIIPLRVKRFKKVFGMGELQYINFEDSFSDGLAELLETLERQNVAKLLTPVVQPQWEQHRRRSEVVLSDRDEVLTSNWLLVESAPDLIAYVAPKGPVDRLKLRKRAISFSYPTHPHWSGFITFASAFDCEEHFTGFGAFSSVSTIKLEEFINDGWQDLNIRSRDARRMLTSLFRQAWEKRLSREVFQEYEWSGGIGYHAGPEQVRLNQQIPWGPKENKRRSALRNQAKKRIWSFGLTATANLFPQPHYRLKARVLFSEINEQAIPGEDPQGAVIGNKEKQHSYRRSDCKGWRNKAWHGRQMAFLELLAGDDPYISLPVGAGGEITVPVSPMQLVSPVSTPSVNTEDDEEEDDYTTLNGGPYADEEDNDA